MIPTGLRRMCDELGFAGLLALGLLATAALFLLLVLKPLEARHEALERRFAQSARPGSSANSDLIRTSTPEAKLAAFYRFFETEEETTDLLARLYGIGKAAGIELHSADYRMEQTGTRVQRYRIVLPLTGGYSQIRAFIKNALIEIPVLSLDQINIKRERANEALVEAEASFTLHLTEPPKRTPGGEPGPQRLALPGTVGPGQFDPELGSSLQ